MRKFVCLQAALTGKYPCMSARQPGEQGTQGGWRSGDYLELVRNTMAHQGAHIDGGGPERRM